MSPTSIGVGDPKSAILFVHGLGGSYWTWNKFSVHLKVHWKKNDPFSLEYDEYYENQGFLYTTPIIRKIAKLVRIMIGPNIEGLSHHLKTVINEVCDEYENVIIIAHSMGGLVARRYIINQLVETKSVGKVKALITYATPHRGSVLANNYLIIIGYLRHLFNLPTKANQISQLSKNGSFITNLNKSWSDLRVEDKIDFKRVVGLGDWVVDIQSSSFKNDPNVFEIANKNHFTIIQPFRDKDPAFMVTFNYLKKFNENLELKKETEEEYKFIDEE